MAGSILLFLVFIMLVMSGQKGGDTFLSNPWLSGTIPSAAGLALGGGGVGLVAASKDRDRSVGVVAAVVLGTLVLFWIVGEVAFPH